MTEVLPVSGRTCDQGHLHVDLNMGLVEVIALDGSGPAEPGELGTMVVTPFFPYRDCMPVFRYDTRDVVRRLPDEPLTCNLAGVPPCRPILGKAGQLQPTSTGLVTPRDIVEVLEAAPGRTMAGPVPRRHRAAASSDSPFRRPTVAGTTTDDVVRRFAARGIECVIDLTASDGPLRDVRADLAETTLHHRSHIHAGV